jgi:hypothetical protein
VLKRKSDFAINAVYQHSASWDDAAFACLIVVHNNTFPFNGGKTYVRMDISASSRDLHQQTDDPTCWLAEVTDEDSSQSRVQK